MAREHGDDDRRNEDHADIQANEDHADIQANEDHADVQANDGLEGGHEHHGGGQDHEDVDERDTSNRYHFVERLMAVPSVDFVVFLTSLSYAVFKLKYSTAGKVLGSLEKCASLAYDSVGQPALDRLSRPLLVADMLACRALQKLELCCPKIKKKPQEIIVHVCILGQKYECIHAYVKERVTAGRDFTERVTDAATHPIDTARACVSLAGNFVDRQLTKAELATDGCMNDFMREVSPDNDPRFDLVPRLMRLTWKFYVCASFHANKERQRKVSSVSGKLSALKRFFDEPAEPILQPTTLSGHAEAAFRHICKASVLFFGGPCDNF